MGAGVPARRSLIDSDRIRQLNRACIRPATPAKTDRDGAGAREQYRLMLQDAETDPSAACDFSGLDFAGISSPRAACRGTSASDLLRSFTFPHEFCRLNACLLDAGCVLP